MRTKPDATIQLTLGPTSVELDEAGYLIDPNQWSPDFACHVANLEKIDLNEAHWYIIGFMREFLDEHGVAADVRFVLKDLAKHENTDKRGAKQMLFTLFPYGYVKQACKIAGMKQPRGWSTG